MIKKIVSMLLVLCLILSSMTSAFADTSYSDMPANNYWAYDALEKAIDNGLIQGYNDKINPKCFVSRAQLATIINRAFGAIEAVDTSVYKDVPNNLWYAKEMGKAVLMGTFKGDSSNKLSPLANATRQETFCVIARALRLRKGNIESLNKFTDKDKIAAWAIEPLAALAEAGYISGSNGRLNPNGKITLEEFAQIMSNVINQYISKTGTYSDLKTGNVMINTTDVALKNTVITGDLIIGEGAGNSDVIHR